MSFLTGKWPPPTHYSNSNEFSHWQMASAIAIWVHLRRLISTFNQFGYFWCVFSISLAPWYCMELWVPNFDEATQFSMKLFKPTVIPNLARGLRYTMQMVFYRRSCGSSLVIKMDLRNVLVYCSMNIFPVDFWELISNFIPHFIGHAITYPCWD